MILFGIGHKARNGKDTVGQYLAQHYGFEVYHFADPLKAEAGLVGWSPENKNQSIASIAQWLEHQAAAGQDMNPMQLEVLGWIRAHPETVRSEVSYIQWHGTELRRVQDPNYWTKKVETWLLPRKLDCERKRRVAICDMRFVNEYKCIKRNGGQTFDIRRFQRTPVGFRGVYMDEPYIDPERDPLHVSETQLDAIPHDFRVDAHSLDELHRSIDNLMLFLDVSKKGN